MRRQVVVSALALMMGCAAPGRAPDARPAESAQPSAAPAPPTAEPGAAETVPAPRPSDAVAPEVPAQDEGAGASAPGQAPDAGAEADAAATFAGDSKVEPPLESKDLTERASALFDAVVKNEPALAEAFWFPKEPFIPLKDVKGPDKYWDNLHAAYLNDVKAMHRKRKSWEGARFVGFQVGSRPKWVPPGDEANKIGYYRSLHGKLKYELDGKPASLDVHTIISWQGRWYITHLGDFKKR
ncbi:hypothetical protein [Sorangium sp. So ce1151]|uniref:hypothetical protein n=1 Tax=Sorangium sp. So ce1151 TaxID=3133332 RepID=UPI003F5F0FBE